MNPLVTNISATQFRRAAVLKERIEGLQHELAKVLNVSQSTASEVNHNASSSRSPRRKMSAAARAKLAEIARARWKKAKAQGKSAL